MHSKSLIRQLRLLTLIVPFIVLPGCFGTGDGESSVTGLATGKVTFSNVSGITFKTPTREGVTGADSVFSYIPGERVTFAIGNINDGIILGTVPGAASITAVELTGTSISMSKNSPAANLIRFIHSLDDDQEHLNGVRISDDVQALAETLNFTLDFSADDFDTQLQLAIDHMFANRTASTNIAVENFCFDTYLPRGGSEVFGFDFEGCSMIPADELLENGGFEEGNKPFVVNVGTIPKQWTGGFNFPDDGPGGYPVAFEGDRSLKMSGPVFFNNDFPEPEAVGVFQDFVPVPLQKYTASVMAQNFNGSLFSPNLFVMTIIFSTDGDFEDGGGEYEFTVLASGDADDPNPDNIYLEPDVWTEVKLTATATLDTVAARFVILHLQFPNSPSDSINDNLPLALRSGVYIDDASVIGPTLEEEPPFEIEYEVVWEDLFDYIGGDIDRSKWFVETGFGQQGWGNQEWQEYKDDPRNLSVTTDGHLKIKAYCDYLESSGVGGVPTNALSNASFELPDAFAGEEPASGNCGDLVMPGWNTSECNFVINSNNFDPITFFPFNPVPVEGIQNLKQYDNSSVSQDVVPATPGRMVAASAYALNWKGFIDFGGPAQEEFDNLARLQIQFLDGGGGVIGTVEEVADTTGTATYTLEPKQGTEISDWTLMEVSAEAPAGTASARLVLQHEVVGAGSATAPVWWDDASLTVSDPVCNVGSASNIDARNGSITSAKINSTMAVEEASEILYGKIEARIKVPVGRGAWPAFWMLGSNWPQVGWPESGEIDIMEAWTILGSNNSTAHSTLHWCPKTDEEEALIAGVCGRLFEGDGLDIGESLGDDFHLYSVEWNPERLLFKIDGEVIYRRVIQASTMEEFNQPFYMILNLAMGGTLGSNQQPPRANGTNWELPQTMLVDYVKVYRASD